VLLGGPEDSFIEDICAVAPERVLNLAGKCSMQVSAAVVSESKMIVANDTGLLHVAEQLGKPAVALMGPAPFGFPSRPATKVMEINLPCRPCSKHGQGPCVNKFKFHQCLVDITPDQVALEVRQLKDKAL
jgi:ADP-heptose:LPS heptosyltransferase